MAFLPTLPNPTTMDDLYVHPFFRMDDTDYPRKASQSSDVLVARPMSISAPGEIIKLDLGGGKKTPPLQTSPIMKRFRAEQDDMLEWNYRSDEELDSPWTKDDLSSRPSFSTVDDDCDDDEVSLVDDDDEQEIDEDDMDLLVDFGLTDAAPAESIIPTDELNQSQTCERCTHAEAVRLIRPGQAKVVVLSKPPGSPHATVIRHASPVSSPPPSPLASASRKPAMPSSQRNSVVMTSSLDRNASISSGKAVSMASSNGHSTASASYSDGQSSGNESLASSQPSSVATTTGTSIGETKTAASSISTAPARRRRRPSLPFLQIKPEVPHVWTMGMPTPQSAKKASNDAPPTKRNSLVSPLTFSFPSSSSTDASSKRATNNTSNAVSKSKTSNPISLRSMWSSAARPLRRMNNLATGSNTNTNTNNPSKAAAPQQSTNAQQAKTVNRRSGQFNPPPPSPTTCSRDTSSSSAMPNSTSDETTSRMVPRPANARAPLPVIPPFPRSSRLSYAERAEERSDASECYDGNLRFSAVDPLEHSNLDDFAELAELADLMHPGFGFLQQHVAPQSSSSSAIGIAAAAPLVTGGENTVDAIPEHDMPTSAFSRDELFNAPGAGLFTPGTPTSDTDDAPAAATSTPVEAST